MYLVNGILLLLPVLVPLTSTRCACWILYYYYEYKMYLVNAILLFLCVLVSLTNIRCACWMPHSAVKKPPDTPARLWALFKSNGDIRYADKI